MIVIVTLKWMIVCLLSRQFTDNFTVNPAFLRNSSDCTNHMVDSKIRDCAIPGFFVNVNRRLLHNSIDDGSLMEFGMVSAWSPWGLAQSNTDYANLSTVFHTMV